MTIFLSSFDFFKDDKRFFCVPLKYRLLSSFWQKKKSSLRTIKSSLKKIVLSKNRPSRTIKSSSKDDFLKGRFLSRTILSSSRTIFFLPKRTIKDDISTERKNVKIVLQGRFFQGRFYRPSRTILSSFEDDFFVFCRFEKKDDI